jgi:hypothetical protein
MTPQTLSDARAVSDAAWRAFLDACQASGFDSEWAAYRSEAGGAPWPESLVAAHAESVRAVHVYYRLRDGDHGFLGGLS